MENNTLFDDVVSLSTPSTSMTSLLNDVEMMNGHEIESTEDPFPSPADPFEDSHYYINITDVDTMDPLGNGTTDRFNIKDLLCHDCWFTYLIIAIGILIVLNIVIGIVIWIHKHKKRLISQSDDPMLSSNYDQGIRWEKICSCCMKSRSGTEATLEPRQNSSSNLESYGRREPLPATAYQSPTEQKQLKPRNAVRDDLPIDNSHLAVYIDGIKDVPTTYIPATEYRELPPLRGAKTNLYQNY